MKSSNKDKKPEEQAFDNENKINEMSLVVIQTENEIVFLVVPTLDFDTNLSTQLENTFAGHDWLKKLDSSVKSSGTFKLKGPNKISYVRLVKKDENADFSKSILFFS